MRRPKSLSLALVVGSLLACTSANTMRLNTQTRPATHPDSVRVLLENPTEAYTTLALISISDQGWEMSFEKLKNRLVKEAAKMGAQAVIVGTQEGPMGSAVFVPAGNTVSMVAFKERKVVGKAIVFAAPPAR